MESWGYTCRKAESTIASLAMFTPSLRMPKRISIYLSTENEQALANRFSGPEINYTRAVNAALAEWRESAPQGTQDEKAKDSDQQQQNRPGQLAPGATPGEGTHNENVV